MNNDAKAVQMAKDWMNLEGEILAHLIMMWKTHELTALGFSGIFEYCLERLKFSRSQAYHFQSVAVKSEVVPELKEAVINGELSISQTRHIVNMVTPENKTEWIDKAKTLTQRELEKEVRAVNPRAHVREKIKPVAADVSELRTTVDRATEENIKVLTEILSQKNGKAATLADVIAFATKLARAKTDPVLRKKISASKRVALRRDGARCTFVSRDGRRCTTQRHLHVHHIQHREHGGSDSVENLTTLCSAHHRYEHQSGAAKPIAVHHLSPTPDRQPALPVPASA